MSSETSTPYTPASTSISVAGNETVSLADKIKKSDTAKLIEYLQGQKNLKLSETAIKILEKEELNGGDFFDMTEEEYMQDSLARGLAKSLVKFTKECKNKKLKSFSSYKTKKDLKEVLAKYGVQDRRITDIPQFTPSYAIWDLSLKVMINKAIRCEYISAILHACINIVRELTGKKISLNPQLKVVGEKNTGHVDYAIQALEELICIIEGKQYQIAIGFA
ncbi:hypothetical protein RhiirA5_434976 [Rhizophagus irregularis]|uniref:Uncharacterized protein n=1 Tax=Rhizophagus irregularis TaxID=588596 RepID=A0A2N0NP53_9GLOM|nr:hypothetical protein RhiirA5_434976 [Rhizophagus irregularis]